MYILIGIVCLTIGYIVGHFIGVKQYIEILDAEFNAFIDMCKTNDRQKEEIHRLKRLLEENNK